MKRLFNIKKEEEKALLLNPIFLNTDDETAVESLLELEQLTQTAGALILQKMNIKLREIDSATFIGSGKLEELNCIKNQLSANIIIFNCELKPNQIRNLEKIFQCKVIGRTELILDIFAQHAKSNEAKIQVELAQLQFLLPRLTGFGVLLSRLGGGIGTRGPGETKLEYDRRHIKQRISTLQKKLNKIVKHREILWDGRKDKTAVLVGYTNAGKSTLLNSLAHEHLATKDALFVTLDSTIRKVYLRDDKYILLADTVGFINNLPHHLIASFRATLEEVKKSDLIIHIVDVSSNLLENKIKTVLEVLSQLDSIQKNRILVFNKIDKLENQAKMERLKNIYPDSIFISAKTKQGLDCLKEAIYKNFY